MGSGSFCLVGSPHWGQVGSEIIISFKSHLLPLQSLTSKNLDLPSSNFSQASFLCNTCYVASTEVYTSVSAHLSFCLERVHD